MQPAAYPQTYWCMRKNATNGPVHSTDRACNGHAAPTSYQQAGKQATSMSKWRLLAVLRLKSQRGRNPNQCHRLWPLFSSTQNLVEHCVSKQASSLLVLALSVEKLESTATSVAKQRQNKLWISLGIGAARFGDDRSN